MDGTVLAISVFPAAKMRHGSGRIPHPPVLRLGGERVLAEDHHVRAVGKQQAEHDHGDEGDSPDGLVHAAFDKLGLFRVRIDRRDGRGGLAYLMEITSNRPATIQLHTSEEPPWDMNGVVRPVSGSNRVTPPMMVNTCNAKANDRPAASSLPKGSDTGGLSADLEPR